MDQVFQIIAAGLILAAAVLAIYFVREYIASLFDKRISAYQNDIFFKYYDELQHIYDQMRGWRHDYHSHIQTMKVLLALGKEAEHTEFLNKLDEDLSKVDTMIKTGNVVLDAILNSKLTLASAKKIKINAKAAVPKELGISEVDLCVIIGNLLDNAIEACERGVEDKFIRCYIGKHKEMLYISVSNSMGGEVKKTGKMFFTSKQSSMHGFGLARIDRITEKYGGYVNRQHEEGVFATEITLPCRQL